MFECTNVYRMFFKYMYSTSSHLIVVYIIISIVQYVHCVIDKSHFNCILAYNSLYL